MTDLTPNHPAVEAAARSAYERTWRCECEHWSEVDDLERDAWRANKAHSLTAALPHLTADDLRDTPAGKQLMAEGWGALIENMSASGEFHDVDLRTMERLNPYLKADA